MACDFFGRVYDQVRGDVWGPIWYLAREMDQALGKVGERVAVTVWDKVRGPVRVRGPVMDQIREEVEGYEKR